LAEVLDIWSAPDAKAFGFLGFGRMKGAGPFGDRELRVATLLTPHLQHAAAFSRLLDIAALQSSSFDALFDSLSAPILIVTGEMRFVHANSSALDLLSRQYPLRILATALG
jgi:PAS domain-containing protein